MRIYIISNNGIALCREMPTALNDGEIVVTSKEELHAAPLNGKRLLALWNALPGAESGKRSVIAQRCSISCGRQSKCCRIPSRDPTRSAPQSRTW